MWYIKKAASKVYTISQNVLKKDTEIEELFKNIISNSNTIMPLKKMTDLSNKTYEFSHFEEAMSLLLQKLGDIKIEKKSLKKRLNLLVLVTYLIKHGASGFIDQFRTNIDSIKKYEHLQHNFNEQIQQNMKEIVNQIRQRAIYIRTLLFDKQILLREKQIARLIKEKIITFNGNFGQKGFEKSEQQKKEAVEKMQGFLEHYVWRYTEKIDRKLDDIADIIIKKIDEYLDLQIPENFQIDQIQSQQFKAPTKTECSLSFQVAKKQEQKFVKEKISDNRIVKQQNLLDVHLEQHVNQKPEQINLISLEQQILGKPQQEQIKIEKKEQISPAIVKPMEDTQIQIFRRQLQLENNPLVVQ